MGGFPSGQRGQTVNLLAMPSMVESIFPHQKIPITLLGDWYFSLPGKMESKFIPVRGNPSSPTKIDKFRKRLVDFTFHSSLFPHSLLFPFETCRFKE